MAQLQRRGMTPDEFLAWEAGQDRRWEFDGFEPVAMAGGTASHSRIQGNMLTSLNNRLRDKPCRPFGNEIKVPVPSGSYRYPDALVTCTKVGPKDTMASEPVVIFEVLSETTAFMDRTVKLAEYLSIPTVRRYVMLEQDAPTITVITRTEAGWSLELMGPDKTLAMPEAGIEVPVAEFYFDVEFPEPPPE